MPSNKRQRGRALRVWVTEEEKAQIESLAGTTRLSVSAYLRNLGLGYVPKSTLDQQAVLTLAKVNGDQGRLGGLLKLWLSDKPGLGTTKGEVRRVLLQIEDLQSELKKLILRL